MTKKKDMVYVIAEIGFNHEGNLDVAAEMIKAASGTGATAVKFQTFRAADIALPSSSHYRDIQCGEMKLRQHLELFKVAKDYGVEFLSTPYSPWAVDLLEKVGVPAYKVASMDCTNKHLLGYVAQTRKPIYLSTGMATIAEISDSLKFLKQEKSGAVSLLHCLSCYPARAQDLNLNIIPFLKQLFHVPVGYSDHYPGVKACLAAVMLGAEIIETHFTLDSSKVGGDHSHSADPARLKELVSDIRLFGEMVGESRAIDHRPDRRLAQRLHRGVYAARSLKKGAIIREADLVFCRPAGQLSPNDVEWLKGKRVMRDVHAYQAIEKGTVSRNLGRQ
jgi:sialic acid synthase SpsE